MKKENKMLKEIYKEYGEKDKRIRNAFWIGFLFGIIFELSILIIFKLIIK
jgi:hypothetical protein